MRQRGLPEIVGWGLRSFLPATRLLPFSPSGLADAACRSLAASGLLFLSLDPSRPEVILDPKSRQPGRRESALTRIQLRNRPCNFAFPNFGRASGVFSWV